MSMGFVSAGFSCAAGGSLKVIGEMTQSHKNVIFPENRYTDSKFQLRNTGSQSVKLLTYQASCSCVSVSFDKTEVRPNELVEVQIRLLNSSIFGSASYAVIVKASDGNHYPFKVNTNVIRSVVISPDIKKLQISKIENFESGGIQFYIYSSIKNMKFPVYVKSTDGLIKPTYEVVASNSKSSIQQYLVKISSKDLLGNDKIRIYDHDNVFLHEYLIEHPQ